MLVEKEKVIDNDVISDTNEKIIVEDIKVDMPDVQTTKIVEDKTENVVQENSETEHIRSRRNTKKRETKQVKQCKVLRYTEKTRTLGLLFDNYGIQIKDVDKPAGDIVSVEYTGEIGKPNFKFSMV